MYKFILNIFVNQKYDVPDKLPARENEFYPASGNGFITEPAIEVTHHDGNTSTDLFYVNHDTQILNDNQAGENGAEKVILKGLNPDKKYKITELNAMNEVSSFALNGQILILKYIYT
jgi:hypothetical protein